MPMMRYKDEVGCVFCPKEEEVAEEQQELEKVKSVSFEDEVKDEDEIAKEAEEVKQVSLPLVCFEIQ